MTNQLAAEAAALPDLDEYFGMSITDICLAAAHWPEGSEDQLRAIAAIRARAPGIGHNRPPLSEALDEELAPRRARADQLLSGNPPPTIIDEISAAKVVDWTSQLKALHDEVDKARLARTEPYRDAWKLINNRYDALKVRLAVAIEGGGKMLTAWDDKQKAAVEVERHRLAEEARRLKQEAEAAKTNAIDALVAKDEAERMQRRAEAIRHEPTRAQLGQTTRRRVIRFVVEDFAARLRDILASPRKGKFEQLVDKMTEHELRDLGVAAVESGVQMAGVRAWIEDGGVSVRR
jgi:hypothetical protein